MELSGQKKILVANPGSISSSAGKQFVVTQSKGTTIIQPADGVGSAPSQQFIVTAVNSNGSTAHSTDQNAAYPTVQYIDAGGHPARTPETVVYTGQNSNNNVHYQFATDSYGGTNQYSYASPNSAVQYQGPGEVVHHMGQTFFIQGGTMDGEGYPLTHTTRAAPATVKWLVDNFEACDGVSLPRSVIYNFYIHHCQAENVEPSNPASFGKLVRMIFRDLKTRRLGQRGNSKYHYYGIRIKPSSPLNQLMPDETPVAMRQPTHPQRRVIKAEADSAPVTPKSEASSGITEPPSVTADDKNRQYLGTPTDAIPHHKISVADSNLPANVTQNDLVIFDDLYKNHCEEILEAVIALRFNLIERLWQQFWRKTSAGVPAKLESRLSKEKLMSLSCMPEVQLYVKTSDYSFYQSLVEVLIPDVLRHIPSSLTQTIRNFAKSLEGWLRSALASAPEEILTAKLTALTAFSQTLRRYTSLNHLAQAARAVLINSTQIQQMLADLARVDFSNIQEQAAWVCQCSDANVRQIEGSFKQYLQEQHSLEEWRDWLEKVLDQILEPYEPAPDHYCRVAKEFLLKWSFYSAMVIRDLTLRSAASFGSFHLIRLLYDEYFFYLVEHKVAAMTQRTPIAVMSELIENNDQLTKHGLQRKQPAQAIPSITAMMTNTNSAGAKPIVLVPLNSASPGSGDSPQAKRYKSIE